MEENVKVAWWKSTWFIVLACIFVPPAGLALLWITEKGNFVVRVILTGVLGVYSLAWITGAIGNIKPKSEPPQTKQTKTETPVVQDFSAAVLTPENVKEAITDKTTKGKITSVTIDNGTVTVAVYDKDILDAKSYIRSNQPNSAGVFEDLFKNKNVQVVVYQSSVDITDSYGKTTQAVAQANTMTRETADKVGDWHTIAYEPMRQYYDIVSFELAPETQISGIHAAWAENYNK